MRKQPKTCEGWALVTRVGVILTRTISDHESSSIMRFCENLTNDWAKCKAMGYRCVRVRIVPVARKRAKK